MNPIYSDFNTRYFTVIECNFWDMFRQSAYWLCPPNHCRAGKLSKCLIYLIGNLVLSTQSVAKIAAPVEECLIFYRHKTYIYRLIQLISISFGCMIARTQTNYQARWRIQIIIVPDHIDDESTFSMKAKHQLQLMLLHCKYNRDHVPETPSALLVRSPKSAKTVGRSQPLANAQCHNRYNYAEIHDLLVAKIRLSNEMPRHRGCRFYVRFRFCVIADGMVWMYPSVYHVSVTWLVRPHNDFWRIKILRNRLI